MADVLRTFVELELDSTVDILHACSAKRVLSISPYSILYCNKAAPRRHIYTSIWLWAWSPKRKDGEVPD
jgi:hypothetical protein